ncbi:hypothetical protein PENTCL1PPCAC_6056, partial [Pristionchus entomophagus]
MAGMASSSEATSASCCPATVSFSSAATVSSFSFFFTSSFTFTDLRGLPRPLKGVFSSSLPSSFSPSTVSIDRRRGRLAGTTTAPLGRRRHLHFLLLYRILHFINGLCGRLAGTAGESLGRRRNYHLLFSILLLFLHFLQRRLAGTAGASKTHDKFRSIFGWCLERRKPNGLRPLLPLGCCCLTPRLRLFGERNGERRQFSSRLLHFFLQSFDGTIRPIIERIHDHLR